MTAKSTNGTGISPAATDHKEKRSTNFIALARRPSRGVLVALREVVSFAMIEAPFPACTEPAVSIAVVASDVASGLCEFAGRVGAVVFQGAASVGPTPLVSAAVGRIALGSVFLFMVTPLV